jgi:Bacterial regulatory proteins, luxR family
VGRNRGHPWGAFHGHRHLGLEELSISPPKALFLSARTIEAHLRQRYRKLDVRSRSELTKLLALAQAPDAGTTG